MVNTNLKNFGDVSTPVGNYSIVLYARNILLRYGKQITGYGTI